MRVEEAKGKGTRVAIYNSYWLRYLHELAAMDYVGI